MFWKLPGGDEQRGLRRSELRAIRRYVNVYGGPETFQKQLSECRFIVVARGSFDDLAVQWNPFDGQFHLLRRGYDKGEYIVAEEIYPTFHTMIATIFGA
jgi:hypothetical protein